jgi:HAD superfamily hydrolase (TIGR01509 family)
VKKILFFLLALTSFVGLPISMTWISSYFYNSPRVHITDTRRSLDISTLPASKTGITMVFDLNGVLLDVDIKKAFNEIGLANILQYVSAHNVSFSHVEKELTHKVYTVLGTIPSLGNKCGARDACGRIMPGIMCDWQAGLKTNAEIKVLAATAIEKHPEWFASAIEKQLVEQIINKMLTPALMASTIALVKDGFKFVQECKKQGHTLVVLSNWDPESFGLIMDKFPELFELFDGVIASGDIQSIKPSCRAYDALVKRKTAHKETIIFIDDQEENIIAARKLGIQGIHCCRKSHFLGFGSRPDFTEIKTRVNKVVAAHTPPESTLALQNKLA